MNDPLLPLIDPTGDDSSTLVLPDVPPPAPRSALIPLVPEPRPAPLAEYRPDKGQIALLPMRVSMEEYTKAVKSIPDARVTRGADDRMELVMPHTLANTLRLWALGHTEVKSPVQMYYDWPAAPGLTPFDAQRRAAGFLAVHDRAFNLSELGTGKTLATLWAWDFLRRVGKSTRLLIIAPLSTVETAWADDCRRHLPHLKVQLLTGTADRRYRRLSEDADVYIINHDGVKVSALESDLRKRRDIDTVVIDELTMVGRNSRSGRWKSLNRLVNMRGFVKRVWGITGAPTPNAPTDAWGQAKLVVPHTTEKYFGKFRGQVMQQVTQYKYVPLPNAKEIVYNTLQPSIRFERKDCLDLPASMMARRAVQMSRDQVQAYKQMKTFLVAQHAQGNISAANSGVMVGKLLQICCGMVYREDGSYAQFPCPDRLRETCDIIDAAEGKAIVFVPYRSSLDWLVQALIGKGYTAEKMDGSTSATRRADLIRRFQNEPDPQVLVGQPNCMSHGLTLTEASVIVWFSAITNNDVFIQANGRTNRPGQTRENHVIMLEGAPIETRMYDTLRNRGTAQDALLAEIRDNTI